MTPADAGQIGFHEPDWRERFADYVARYPKPKVAQRFSSPKLERRLAEDYAFERTLRDWRRFHGTEVDELRDDGTKKHMPASAKDGCIALAGLGIMPPRSIHRDLPRGGPCFEEQIDAHCDLQIAQRAWRIRAIEDRTLMLDSFGEQMQIDLNRANWKNYCETAAAVLGAFNASAGINPAPTHPDQRIHSQTPTAPSSHLAETAWRHPK